MRFFVRGHFGQARVDAGRGGGVAEVGWGEFRQALSVKGRFEVFEREGVVEDVDLGGVVSGLVLRKGRVGWVGLPSEKDDRVCLLFKRWAKGWGRARVVATRLAIAA